MEADTGKGEDVKTDILPFFSVRFHRKNFFGERLRSSQVEFYGCTITFYEKNFPGEGIDILHGMDYSVPVKNY